MIYRQPRITGKLYASLPVEPSFPPKAFASSFASHSLARAGRSLTIGTDCILPRLRASGPFHPCFVRQLGRQAITPHALNPQRESSNSEIHLIGPSWPSGSFASQDSGSGFAPHGRQREATGCRGNGAGQAAEQKEIELTYIVAVEWNYPNQKGGKKRLAYHISKTGNRNRISTVAHEKMPTRHSSANDILT